MPRERPVERRAVGIDRRRDVERERLARLTRRAQLDTRDREHPPAARIDTLCALLNPFATSMLLRRFPPMGVYETLFRFADATGTYMGEPGTHPWAQGFPLTTQVPGGPALPDTIRITGTDRMYPKADGQPPLREAIARYYNDFYDAGIRPENVAVFAGGRPGIFTLLALLEDGWRVAIEETEYTPYYDVLELLRLPYDLIPSNEVNRFRPTLADHPTADRTLLIKSNPCNPTGVAVGGGDLRALVEHYSTSGRAALIDEAYEFFNDPAPESALAHVDDIDATNLFVVGAATKGLQVPGMRVGWVVAAERYIELFRNFSSMGMGGVSRPSQLYVTELLEPARVKHAREAITTFYKSQRERYGEVLSRLGVELFTGNGGFYHWGRLPEGLTGDRFNERLFEHNAGILPGRLCDMARRGDDGPLGPMIRFSFGPLAPDSFERDAEILEAVLKPASVR